MREPQKIIQATRNGLDSLISGALIAKLLNFICNTIIINTIGNKVLGTGSLRLGDLLFMGPLVLTREGLRRAAYRIDIKSKDSDINAKQSLINLTWCVAPITVVAAMVFQLYMYLSPPAKIVCCDGGRTMLQGNIASIFNTCRGVTCDDTNVSISSYYRAMLYTFLAVLLAVLTEPVYVLAQSKLWTKLRTNIETCAVLGKCLAMMYLTVGLGMDVEAFAIANIIYAFIPLCGYWGYMVYHKEFPRPKPFTTSTATTQWCTTVIHEKAKVFWWQSIQKWLLENGAKFVLLGLGTETEQGGYVIVSNLGSIVVRLFFQPVEEQSMAALGKLTELEKSTSTTNKAAEEKEKKKNITELVHRNFSGWLLLLVLIGLMFACFGPCYSHLLLHLLYGTTWSATSAPVTLGWFCIYILFLATNGLCEAFVQGTSTPEDIQKYNRWMVFFTFVYAGCVITLFPLFGAIGLVLADIIKMLCRISVCGIVYIRPYFRERGKKTFTLTSLLPHTNVLLLFFGSLVFLQCTQYFMYMPAILLHTKNEMQTKTMLMRLYSVLFSKYVAAHVVCGIGCLVVTGRSIWKHHGKQLKELRAKDKKMD